MTGIGENTLAQPVKPPLRERRACLAKLVKNRLTLTEVVHRDFGTDAAEIAEWALGFEEPRACYESGPTGFHMARELRALGLDCAVAAVSKMQRPAADARRKNDRRDAEFIARMLATHNIVEVPLPDMAVEAARDLDRALDDATRELRRSRQRLNMFLIRLGHVWG